MYRTDIIPMELNLASLICPSLSLISRRYHHRGCLSTIWLHTHLSRYSPPVWVLWTPRTSAKASWGIPLDLLKTEQTRIVLRPPHQPRTHPRRHSHCVRLHTQKLPRRTPREPRTIFTSTQFRVRPWWWGRLGSNQRPIGYEPTALTPELRPRETYYSASEVIIEVFRRQFARLLTKK